MFTISFNFQGVSKCNQIVVGLQYFHTEQTFFILKRLFHAIKLKLFLRRAIFDHQVHVTTFLLLL